MNTHICTAIERAGGATKLARELGITSQAVSQWASGKRKVSARFALPIERMRLGVSARDLRPDVFGG